LNLLGDLRSKNSRKRTNNKVWPKKDNWYWTNIYLPFIDNNFILNSLKQLS